MPTIYNITEIRYTEQNNNFELRTEASFTSNNYQTDYITMNKRRTGV